ncbi:ChrR family anti-sigma-E factor [Pseudoalteromonas mariniglutinosa]|uniref:ChrR family anti-sigma-E factor n=1 Tax=Pseudoalteromonas mariniglutinosa TaxID=206042 RepID=UPI00384EDA63
MIKYHPSNELLSQFSEAGLPATLSVAVAIHVEMCPVCQQKVAALEAATAATIFSDEPDPSDQEVMTFDDSLLDAITCDETIDEVYQQPATKVTIKEQHYTLPRALTRIGQSNFIHVGKLARSRTVIDDGPLRASLLHIDAGGEIPEHTHTGFEVTLLLDGEFSDEQGHYVPGDFMMLDGRHQHTPMTKEGCLCFTVVSSALHFNKGLSKLLNPIGSLIY